MKKIINIFYLFILSSTISSTNNVQITCFIGDEINKDDQWVYLFHIRANEFEMPDSCYIIKGQTEFTLKTHIDDSSTDFCWLTFSKTGPIQLSFLLSGRDSIKIYISKPDEKEPHIEGAQAAIEDYEDRNKVRKIKQRINLLTDSLYVVKDDIVSQQIIDSLNYYNEYLSIGLNLDRIRETKVANTYLSRIKRLSKLISKTTIDSLVIDMKNRFPNNENIQMYPIKKVYPQASYKSKVIENRYQEILDNRVGRHVQREPQDTIKVDSIYTFRLHDIVENFEIEGMEGENISISSIKSKYIFIDFWATWCAPCLQEIPYIKQAHAKFSDKLEIFAISFDNSKEEWKRSININRTKKFIQVYGGDMLSLEAKILCKKFGINAIPANFLLDEEHRIIAINLRGEELEKKMIELRSKEE